MPLLLRSPLLNLPVVLATDFPPVQIVCMSVVLSTMMVSGIERGGSSDRVSVMFFPAPRCVDSSKVLQMLYWPWKVLVFHMIKRKIQ